VTGVYRKTNLSEDGEKKSSELSNKSWQSVMLGKNRSVTKD